jgi:hypothetical protein
MHGTRAIQPGSRCHETARRSIAGRIAERSLGAEDGGCQSELGHSAADAARFAQWRDELVGRLHSGDWHDGISYV